MWKGTPEAGKRKDMKWENFDDGDPEEAWESARAEGRQAMVAVASRRRVVAYSDLVAEIGGLDLEPRGEPLAHMLGEISTAEQEAGRGMLTVVAVRKHGDQRHGLVSSGSRGRWVTTRRSGRRCGSGK